jgi:hypothetical protein
MINRSRKRSLRGETADIGALMGKQELLIDIQSDQGLSTWAAIKSFRDAREAPPLLLLYPINPDSEPPQRSITLRENLGAAHEVLGIAMYFPGHDHVRNYVQAPPPPEAAPEDLVVPADEDLVVTADRNLD